MLKPIETENYGTIYIEPRNILCFFEQIISGERYTKINFPNYDLAAKISIDAFKRSLNIK